MLMFAEGGDLKDQIGSVLDSDRTSKYCITGIFPGTFISRKMMFSTFSRFLISRPAHGCIDIKFTESVCFRF